MRTPTTTDELMRCDPADVARAVVRSEIEEELRDACGVMTATKVVYLADPIEANLRAFCLALREAERLTKIALDLSEHRA